MLWPGPHTRPITSKSLGWDQDLKNSTNLLGGCHVRTRLEFEGVSGQHHVLAVAEACGLQKRRKVQQQSIYPKCPRGTRAGPLIIWFSLESPKRKRAVPTDAVDECRVCV